MSIKMVSSKDMDKIFDESMVETLEKGLNNEVGFDKLPDKTKEQLSETYTAAGMLFIMNFKKEFFNKLNNVDKKKEN